MPQPSTDEEREQRITYEIIVDCYDDYEVAMGWYCYLADRLNFPFAAQRTSSAVSSSSAQSERVRVIGMADEADCKTDILVSIEYREQDLTVTDVFAVPLAEIEPLELDDTEDLDAARSQAIEDWQYWLAQGNELIDPDAYEEY